MTRHDRIKPRYAGKEGIALPPSITAHQCGQTGLKVDGCVPNEQHVQLGIVSQYD